MWLVLFPVILILITAVWLWQRRHFAYWQRRGVATIAATPFVGNIKNLLLYNCCFGEQFKQLYEAPEARNQGFVGIHVLHNHAILLRSPELIRQVLVQDFNKFSSRFESTDPVGDPMGSLNLFFAKYAVWKDIHKIFTPFFAAGKIKQMYSLLQQIGVQLEHHMAHLSHDSSTQSVEIEVKQMCALFTTDLIASLAFGIEANSLRNPSAEFRKMLIEVNEPRPKRVTHLFTLFFFPSFVRQIRAHLYSPVYEHFMRDSINYMMQKREESNLKRNDLVDIFLQLKQSYPVDSVVHEPDFFVAQAAFLMLAGFDTSSSTITFGLYELAKHPELQRRLREELRLALQQDNGTLSYDTVNDLEYLRMVVDEVLRLYPPTAFLDRCCTAENGYSLEPWSSFVVPKGMPAYISVLGLHRDENLWPNANSFDPERFAQQSRLKQKPMSYLPFGAGPRSCIGTLLGLLEIKIGLIHILRNYFVEPCERTLPEMRFHAKTFVLAPDDGTCLRFVKDTLE